MKKGKQKFAMILLSLSILISNFISLSIPINANVGSDDLALNKGAVASTTESDARGTQYAFDGDASSRWASDVGVDESGIDETWIYVDLGSPMDINKVVISWESRPNKFKMQISDNGINWTDFGEEVDNGTFNQEGSAPKAVTNTIENETVKTQYVKMQGIERRKENSTSRTGYSIYGFEVYGPQWDDSTYVTNYLSTLKVPSKASKNFTLPISNSEYGVSVAWSSDNEAVQAQADGTMIVQKQEQEQTVTLTATVTRNDAIENKKFPIQIASNAVLDYNIYPIPRNMKSKDGALELSGKINLVVGESVDNYTLGHLEEVLTTQGYEYEKSDEIVEDGTNILISVRDNEDVINSYFDDVEYSSENSTNNTEGYVLDVNYEENIVAILGADNTGASYGVATLDQMINQTDGNLKEVLIEDYPETAFRGFIEGFYGTPWSHENRKSLMEFCGDYKMNTYIYGPKNDPYHAASWRDPYPEDKLAELAELVEVGNQSNVEFVWAIHVGGRIDLGNPEDIQKVKDKFDQLHGIGVRQFAVFFDDSSTNNEQLVSFMNDLQQNYVEKKDGVKPLVFCPQYYNKKNGNEAYLKNLRNFDKDIEIMWTGDYVVSRINQPVIDYIVNLIERPVYIWWNYPVNDLGRAHLLHMGPTEALAPGIQNMSGLVSNPMNQAQANKVSLFSIANYSWNSADYDSDQSWRDSWSRIITDDAEALTAFEIFVQNCSSAPMSFSDTDESVYLKPSIEAFEEKYYNGESYIEEANQLIASFQEIHNSIEVLRSYTGTNNISKEIAPWMNVVDDIAIAGESSLLGLLELEAIDKNNDQSIENALKYVEESRALLKKSTTSGKQAGNKTLYPFVEKLLDNVEEDIYASLEMNSPLKITGSGKVDYSLALDGNTDTVVELGAQGIDGNIVINLGKTTPVNTIELIFNEKDSKGKSAFYKKGVLEYSSDNINWTPIGEYDTSTIKVDNCNIEARFIRYRATEIFENIATGENISNIQFKEVYVNKAEFASIYTNKKNFSTEIIKDGLSMKLSPVNDIVLEKDEYIGVAFAQLKNIHSVSLEGTDLNLEYSIDGKKWEKLELNKTEVHQAKYLRLYNDKKDSVTFDLEELSVRLGGIPKLSSTIHNSSIWEGNANNMTDGNPSTYLWLKSGDLTRYVELELSDTVSLYDINILCDKDILSKGHIDVSTDKNDWKTIKEFDKGGKDNTILLDGEQAKYIRIYIDVTGWIKIHEIKVNTTVKENVSIVNGADSSVENTIDNRIFTSYKAAEEKGELTYSGINLNDENVFTIFKNSGTTVKVEAKYDTGWKDLGEFTGVFNEVNFSKGVEEFKVSWDKASGVEIHELFVSNRSDIEVNRTLLIQTIEKARFLEENGGLKDVNELVKAYFYTSLADALLINNKSDATQLEVNEATEKLMLAIQMLDFKSDKKELKALIEECEAIDLNEYEEKGQEEFSAALKNAKDVYNDPAALTERIEDAIDKLLDAKSKLVKKQVNTSQLEYMIKLADKAVENSDNYKQDKNWDKFTKSLETAKKALTDKKSQEAVNEACEKLADAYSNLRLKPNEEMLEELQSFIKMTTGLDYSKYKIESQNIIKQAVTASEKALEDENITQAELMETYGLVIKAKEIIANPDANKEDIEEGDGSKPEGNTGDKDIEKPATDKKKDLSGKKDSGTATGDTSNQNTLIMLVLLSGTLLVLRGKKKLKSKK